MGASPSVSESFPADEPDRRPGCVGFVVTAAVLAAAVFVLAALLGRSHAGDKAEAIDLCHDLVEQRLGAASTADYSDESTSGSRPDWTVAGAVRTRDATRSLLRTYYRCDVSWISGHHWETPRSVQFGDAPFRP